MEKLMVTPNSPLAGINRIDATVARTDCANLSDQAINSMKRKKARFEPGFTLVELLVAMLLALMVMGTIYSVFRVQGRTVKSQESRLEAQEYARAVLDIMVREIRNAGYTKTGAACAGVVSADTQTVQFRLDSNGDGDCADADEDITYGFDATGCPAGLGNVTRRDGANPALAMTDCNVPAASFAIGYFPKDSAAPFPNPVAAASLGSIQRVSIALTVQSKNPDPQFGGQFLALVTSNADLRNRGLPP